MTALITVIAVYFGVAVAWRIVFMLLAKVAMYDHREYGILYRDDQKKKAAIAHHSRSQQWLYWPVSMFHLAFTTPPGLANFLNEANAELARKQLDELDRAIAKEMALRKEAEQSRAKYESLLTAGRVHTGQDGEEVVLKTITGVDPISAGAGDPEAEALYYKVKARRILAEKVRARRTARK